MGQLVAHTEMVETPPPPDTSHLITEDDSPVDNLFSEKQQRLLTRSLYSSWPGPGEGRPFLAAANVAVYFAVRQPAIVPDVFLSLDVEMPPHGGKRLAVLICSGRWANRRMWQLKLFPMPKAEKWAANGKFMRGLALLIM